MSREELLGSAVLALAAALWPPSPRVGPGPSKLGAETAAPATSANELPMAGADLDAWEADLNAAEVGRRLAAIIRLGTLATPRSLRLITPFLDAPDSALRLAAARALVRAGDDQTLARLVGQASNASAPVRFEALTILREAASLPPAGRQAAERALSDADPATRLLALDVLAVHRSSDSVPSIAAVLADGNRDVRLSAVRVLGLAPDGRALLPLLDRLETPERTERLALIDTLARFGGKHPRLEPGPAVLRQLSDANDDVRAAAVDALGTLRWSPAVGALRRIAGQHPRERLARRATLALGRIGTPEAIATLVDLLRTPAPTEELVSALATAGTAAVSSVSAVLQEGSTTSAVAASHILGEIGDRAATPALVNALTTSATGAPTIAAARALERLGDPEAGPPLMAAVSAPKYGDLPGVQEACVNALIVLGDVRAAALVPKLVRAGDPRLRIAGLKLAAAVQSGIAPAALMALLDDGEPAVRLAAVETAARFPTLRLIAPLVKAALRGGGTARDDQTMSDVLETAVTPGAGDRPLLTEAFVRAPAPRRHLLLPALVATASGGPLAPLPDALASPLVDLLARDASEAGQAAEALSAFALDARTIRAVIVALPALASPARARLCPALSHARSSEADRALLDLLAHDPQPAVRAAAAWALAGRSDEPVLAAALGQAARSTPGPVAANARAALARARPDLPASRRSTTSTARAAAAAKLARARWLRTRLRAPDGMPIIGRWVMLRAGSLQLWAFTDEIGTCAFSDLPAGPYQLSAEGAGDAVSMVLTTAMASGRSPAMTPVAP